jgi:amino acid transporter
MPFWITVFFSDIKAHVEAVEEILVVSIVSLIPLFLLAVVDQLRGHSDLDFILFWDAISSGQLYLYSFAMLGMIFWLCWKDHEHLVRFPPRKYLALVAFVLSVIVIAVYTVDPSLSKQLSSPLVKASVVVYLVYTALYYILRVYDNLRPPSVGGSLASAADALQARYEKQTQDSGQ